MNGCHLIDKCQSVGQQYFRPCSHYTVLLCGASRLVYRIRFLFTLETIIWAHFLYRTAAETMRFSKWYVTIRFYSIHRIMLMWTQRRIKILTPKQMLQRLPIALAQVKAGNNSESLLNEIRQIVYSLYQWKHITKKVYNNIIKSI